MRDFKQVIEYENDESLGRMIIAICGDRITCKKITGCNINFYSLLDYLLSNVEVQRRLIMFSEAEYERKQFFDIRIEESVYHSKNIYFDACDNNLEYVKYSEKLIHISSNDKIESLELWLGDFIEIVAKIRELGYCSSWKSDIREIDTVWKSGTLECSDISTLMSVNSHIIMAKKRYAKYRVIELWCSDKLVLYTQSPSIDGYWSKTIWVPNNINNEGCIVFDRMVSYNHHCVEGGEEIIDSVELEHDLHTIRCSAQNWIER